MQVLLGPKELLFIFYFLFGVFLLVVLLGFPYIMARLKGEDKTKTPEKKVDVPPAPTILGVARPQEEYSDKNIFLAIPYGEYDRCEDVLKNVLTVAQLVPLVAKGQLTSPLCVDSIRDLVELCKYAVADISFSCDTVLYELGLLGGLEKKTCILLGKEAERSTDLKELVHVQYAGERELTIKFSQWLIENSPESNGDSLNELITSTSKELKEKGEVPFL
jgi:hypothetical protein